MARRVIPPRRQAPGAAHFSDWMATTHLESRSVNDLPPWDYATPLELTCEGRLDLQMVEVGCGLSADRGAKFAVAATVECRDTLWKLTELTPISSSPVPIRLTVAPGVAARSIRLTRQVVVTDPGADSEPLAPDRGHVIDGRDDGTTVTLEGEGGRFPTVAVSFSEMGLPDAPWHLSLVYDDPGEIFAGCVQLMLNVDNPVVRQMIEPSTSADESATINARLSFDIARQLVMHAVHDDRLTLSTRWGPESVGGTLEALCARTPRQTTKGCRSAYAQNRDHFETELKAALGGGA